VNVKRTTKIRPVGWVASRMANTLLATAVIARREPNEDEAANQTEHVDWTARN
jgi:hypothetical protein